MKHKAFRSGQDRHGNPDRRQLEFNVIKDQIARRKAKFIARLERMTRAEGGCLVGLGTRDRKGYPRMNFLYKGLHVTIHMMRIFIILKRSAPIPLGMDVGHAPECVDHRCVIHIKLQPFRENCNTYHKRKKEQQ